MTLFAAVLWTVRMLAVRCREINIKIGGAKKLFLSFSAPLPICAVTAAFLQREGSMKMGEPSGRDGLIADRSKGFGAAAQFARQPLCLCSLVPDAETERGSPSEASAPFGQAGMPPKVRRQALHSVLFMLSGVFDEPEYKNQHDLQRDADDENQ